MLPDIRDHDGIVFLSLAIIQRHFEPTGELAAAGAH
jgi:hypothetical protein